MNAEQITKNLVDMFERAKSPITEGQRMLLAGAMAVYMAPKEDLSWVCKTVVGGKPLYFRTGKENITADAYQAKRMTKIQALGMVANLRGLWLAEQYPFVDYKIRPNFDAAIQHPTTKEEALAVLAVWSRPGSLAYTVEKAQKIHELLAS